MAIWQCDLHILPAAAFKRRRGGMPHEISTKQFNRINVTAHSWLPKDHAHQLSKLLPEIPTWSPQVRWWGNEIGDRIDIRYDDHKPCHFKIRIDVRKINSILLRDFLALLREWDCVLCSSETGQLLRPTRSAVLGYLVGSFTLATTWRWLGDKSDEGASVGRRPIFICHSSKDKPFVRKLAGDLRAFGIPVWLDEWELLPGDSLNEKIQQGLSDSSWLLVILSKSSVKSRWVTRELNAGLTEELHRRDSFVVPVRIDLCRVPLFLRDKSYANFRVSYADGLAALLRRFDGDA
jgi:TIR domain